jgi:hypothetical protein
VYEESSTVVVRPLVSPSQSVNGHAPAVGELVAVTVIVVAPLAGEELTVA